MDVIFTILLQIWLWQQCVPVPHKIMGYRIVNVYYAVVRNSPLLVYLIRIQIKMQQTRVQKSVFVFTKIYHVVLFITYTHINNKPYVLCVPVLVVM